MYKEKYEKNGVTYYCEEGDRLCKCYDIDIEDNIDEITFARVSGLNSYSPVFMLSNSKKCFPDIKKIKIEGYDTKVYLPNSMFPNVKEIVCKQGYYQQKSKNLLIYKGHLVNVFVSNPDDRIDMKGVSEIDDYAFKGCPSKKIVNSGNVRRCSAKAFTDSAIGDLKAPSGSAITVGSIITSIDDNSTDIVLPDSRTTLTAALNGLRFDKIKTLTVHKIQTLINLQWYISSDTKVILKDKNMISREQLMTWKKIPKLELPEGNPYYTSIDGALYTKDKSNLIKYPSKTTGTVFVPEGTKVISAFAFHSCDVKRIHFPDSLRILMPHSIAQCSDLKNVDFGIGIKELGIGHNGKVFDGCENLNEVEIPSQVRIIGESFFEGSGLKKITLHEGLTQIQDNAFVGCEIKNIVIPASVQYIGQRNFLYTNKITLLDDKIPYGLIAALTSDIALNGDGTYVIINKPSKSVVVPRYMDRVDAYTADENLVISSLREFNENCLFEYGASPEVKWDAAITAYDIDRTNEKAAAYLRKVATNIVKRYIERNDEENLVEFIKFGVMTTNGLESTIDLAKKSGMTSAAAYALNAQNQAKDGTSSFKL